MHFTSLIHCILLQIKAAPTDLQNTWWKCMESSRTGHTLQTMYAVFRTGHKWNPFGPWMPNASYYRPSGMGVNTAAIKRIYCISNYDLRYDSWVKKNRSGTVLLRTDLIWSSRIDRSLQCAHNLLRLVMIVYLMKPKPDTSLLISKRLHRGENGKHECGIDLWVNQIKFQGAAGFEIKCASNAAPRLNLHLLSFFFHRHQHRTTDGLNSIQRSKMTNVG
jgi:hypothetical protein